jgi:redox-sensing transcriptional repressor
MLRARGEVQSVVPKGEESNRSESERPFASAEPHLSRASAGRLSLYLRCLEALQSEGAQKVSSGQLGESLGVSDAQVRKDLACLGNLGQPGIGYYAADLTAAIRKALGIDRTWNTVLVGVGNLARALLKYSGFQQQGFHILALCDNDPGKVGQTIENLPVYSLEKIAEKIRAAEIELGILSVPAEAAQPVADQLVAAGIRGILNFAPIVLKLPPGVSLVTVDLAIQLEQLAFLVQWSAQER